VTERLMQVHPALAKEARKVLDVNKAERHIRGGLATREKYQSKRETTCDLRGRTL
jgi:putative DeoR family transcriptional regulator (stage III sporulation protein D)